MLGTTALFVQQNINNRGHGDAEKRKSIEQTFEQECTVSAKSMSFDRASITSDRATVNDDDCGNFWSQLNRFYTYLVERPLLFCVIVYIMFITVGITFFATFFGWNFGTSFYLAMGTGLNIGPCQPSLGPPTGVKVFTVFYILCSSCVICGVVGFGLSTLTYTKVDFFHVNHSDISMYHTNPADGTTKITIFSFCNYIWTRIKFYCGWYTTRTRTISVLVALTWLSFGVLYGIYGLGYDFITALYWALGTASTAGFYAPECINGTSGENCDMGNVRGTIMAIYMTFGCPLYALTCAQFAGSVLSYAIELRQAKLLREPIEEAEFIFAANILSESSDTLQMGEFILLELMKLGCTDQDQITRLKQKFYTLDKAGKGVLNLADLRLSGRVVSSKVANLEVAKALKSKRRRRRRSSISNMLAAFTSTSPSAGESSERDMQSSSNSLVTAPNTHGDNGGQSLLSQNNPSYSQKGGMAAAAREAIRLSFGNDKDNHNNLGRQESSDMSISSTMPTSTEEPRNKKKRPSLYGYTSFAHSYAAYIRRGSNSSVCSHVSDPPSPMETPAAVMRKSPRSEDFPVKEDNTSATIQQQITRTSGTLGDLEQGKYNDKDSPATDSAKRQKLVLKLLGHEFTPETEMFSLANDWESIPPDTVVGFSVNGRSPGTALRTTASEEKVTEIKETTSRGFNLDGAVDKGSMDAHSGLGSQLDSTSISTPSPGAVKTVPAVDDSGNAATNVSLSPLTSSSSLLNDSSTGTFRLPVLLDDISESHFDPNGPVDSPNFAASSSYIDGHAYAVIADTADAGGGSTENKVGHLVTTDDSNICSVLEESGPSVSSVDVEYTSSIQGAFIDI